MPPTLYAYIWRTSRRAQIILCVLTVGGWLVVQGRVEVGTLVVFISGFQKVADPWDQLTGFYRMLSNARVKYRLIADTLPDGATPVR